MLKQTRRAATRDGGLMTQTMRVAGDPSRIGLARRVRRSALDRAAFAWRARRAQSHVLHITTREEMAFLASQGCRGCEATPHHLTSAEDYPRWARKYR
jgi:dihydroorotase-like cyclic amidohydrolase